MNPNPNPLPFEEEYPEEAAFLKRVYTVGRIIILFDTPPNGIYREKIIGPFAIPRNTLCPCASGRKTKKCHPIWCLT